MTPAVPSPVSTPSTTSPSTSSSPRAVQISLPGLASLLASLLLPRFARSSRRSLPFTLPSVAAPLPTIPAPAIPAPAIPAPSTTAPAPVTAAPPASVPSTAPGALPSPALTPVAAPSALSEPYAQGQSCETPSQTRARRDRQRENCARFVTIRVPAHTKRVCAAEAGRHIGRHLGRELGKVIGEKLGLRKPRKSKPRKLRVSKRGTISYGNIGVAVPKKLLPKFPGGVPRI